MQCNTFRVLVALVLSLSKYKKLPCENMAAANLGGKVTKKRFNSLYKPRVVLEA